MKKRLGEFDFIRVISMFAVIMIHTSGTYVGKLNLAYGLNQLARFAVPVFILISGFLLYYSDIDKQKQESYLVFLNKRFKKILLPYVLWSVFYLCVYRTPGESVFNLKKISESLLYGSASYHLYFVLIILQLYLIYPFLRNMFRKHSNYLLGASFVLTLYYQSSIYLGALGVNLPLGTLLFPNYMFIATWIFYFVLGMYLMKVYDKFKKITNYYSVTAIVWLLCAFLLIFDSKITGTYESSVKPVILLYSVVSFTFLYTVYVKAIAKYKGIEGLTRWLGAQAFLIYLSHAFILDKLLVIIRGRGIRFLSETSVGMLIVYIITCALTLCFVYAVSKIPCSKFIGSEVGKRAVKLEAPLDNSGAIV